MKIKLLALAVMLVGSCQPTDSNPPMVVELPRPNSGQFTSEQAENRKAEIYGLVPSEVMLDWENPYAGFCVHVTDGDELIVYNGSLLSKMPDQDEGNGVRLQQLSQLQTIVDTHMGFVFGNPIGVLITSSGGGASAILPDLVDMLFRPSIQIYYLGDT